MDTSGYQVSYLDGVEFNCENDQLALDAVLTPGINTSSLHSTFNNFELGTMAENPIVVDKEQEKANSPPPHPTTPVSERSTKPLVDEKSSFWDKRRECPYHIYGNLFKNLSVCYCVCILITTIFNVFHFIISFFKN